MILSLNLLKLMLDFSKAFDVIDHSLLIRKLWNLGIHGNVYPLIQSYLSNLYQSIILIILKNTCSEFNKVVPFGVHKDLT